ncbi:50S ribosomal protein L9 [Candidatus Sulfidibacterium hydrothermale]|uniref:50S ribosomal protein L9 n=1 Tax=Candidatus Sulfidibacterium hydrothermale TaxID=2875962 RepID=UPI001F0AE2C5|nr:50S ribosomal protein L9 [Candidatus Sulfidibacterium hydrothermale]UBM63352.1 50S ribosomal protein L9 [Candidatus Sulfidibacterium hydrothermale]
MEIILKQDINGLGYKNDLITVKDGYARNYLIPKGMAIVATDSAKKVLAEVKKQQAYKEEKIRKEAEELAKVLEGAQLTIGVKASTKGKIFGSVNNIMIADAIKDQKKVEVDRKKIEVNGDAIKEVGTYKATVKLHKDIAVEVQLDVKAE